MLTCSLVAGAGEKPWYDRYGDRYVRWREKRHQARSEGIPSPEAVDEATAYYAGLYTQNPPDPCAFKRLLERRGVPDWTNPYDISDERYHLLHPEGFLWADVQFLAQDLLDRDVERENPEEYTHKVQAAQICWLLVLDQTCGTWPRSLGDIHPDNLAAITLEALLNPYLSSWPLSTHQWTGLTL